MNVTVIIPCYKRFEQLEEIINAWLAQKEVNDVIVLDNSGMWKTKLPVLVINVSENLGPQGKYPIAHWAKNEWVLFADDDIMPKPGLVEDLIKCSGRNRVVSIIGRIFDSKTYYAQGNSRGTSGFRGENLDKPMRVDWVGGGCTLTHRDLCNVNTRDCPAMEVDDMWWQTHIRHKAELYVAPTSKYEFMEENYDSNALHLSPNVKMYREKYYRTWGYSKNNPPTILRLNVGCGEEKYHLWGWKNIDVDEKCNPDECYDISGGIREKDGSVDEILISHVLMYFTREQVVGILRDCLRALRPGGIIKITEDNRHVKKRNEKQQEQYGNGEIFTRMEMEEIVREGGFVDIQEAEPFLETMHHIYLPKDYPLAKGEAAVYFIRAKKEEKDGYTPTVYLGFDDFSERGSNMDLLWRLRGYFDDFKINMFTIPSVCSEEWLKYIDNLGWIGLNVHGYNHIHNEVVDEIALRETTSKYFRMGYKAPFWELPDEMYERLRELGFKIFLQPSDSREGIKYNWDVMDAPPRLSILHGYGHVYPHDYQGKHGGSGNSLHACMDSIFKLPKNTKFELY